MTYFISISVPSDSSKNVSFSNVANLIKSTYIKGNDVNRHLEAIGLGEFGDRNLRIPIRIRNQMRRIVDERFSLLGDLDTILSADNIDKVRRCLYLTVVEFNFEMITKMKNLIFYERECIEEWRDSKDALREFGVDKVLSKFVDYDLGGEAKITAFIFIKKTKKYLRLDHPYGDLESRLTSELSIAFYSDMIDDIISAEKPT